MEKLTKFKTSINKFPIKNKEDEQNERLRKIHTFQATIKDFKDYINQRIEDTKIEEKLTLNDISKMKRKYNYQPKNKEELKSLMKQLIKERGNEGDFNDIDTSLITNMTFMFYENEKFNGDISQWNTSNVTNMTFMFEGAESFNQPIGRWDTSKVTDMSYMFYSAESFNQDISNWNVKNVKTSNYIFDNCHIKEEHKPKFK